VLRSAVSIRLIVFDGRAADRHQVPGVDPGVTAKAFDGHRVEDGLAPRQLSHGGRWTDAVGDDELGGNPRGVVVDRVVPRTACSVLQVVHRLGQVVNRPSSVLTRRPGVAP